MQTKLGSLSSSRLGGARRRAVSLSPEELVRIEPLGPESRLPVVVRPNLSGVQLGAWAASNRERIEQLVNEHGGILFRGFGLSSVDDFESTVGALAEGGLLEYKERSSPRSAVTERVYTSTDYPADQPIFLHNENSYQHTWPLRIFFFCHTAPAEGGETPIADTRRIYERVSPEIRDRFREKGWMYVRNFGDGLGLDWRVVFQTEDRSVVEDYCRQNGIECEWKSGGRLCTRSRRRAIAVHPGTGELVWFNHATFFHVTTLPETIRTALLNEFQEEDLPTNTFYGDGSPIEPETLDELRRLYAEETVRYSWQRGDLLMLDNMLVAHGRAPFKGERKILVGMADPCSWADLPELPEVG